MTKKRRHFLHDCKECTFLGCTEDEGGPVDMYICLKTSVFKSIIARFGSEPQDYASAPHVVFVDKATVESLKETNSALVEAHGLAVAAGHLKC